MAFRRVRVPRRLHAGRKFRVAMRLRGRPQRLGESTLQHLRRAGRILPRRRRGALRVRGRLRRECVLNHRRWQRTRNGSPPFPLFRARVLLLLVSRLRPLSVLDLFFFLLFLLFLVENGAGLL
jgi:hypothetical protein